jgi:hypothetical protein
MWCIAKGLVLRMIEKLIMASIHFSELLVQSVFLSKLRPRPSCKQVWKHSTFLLTLHTTDTKPTLSEILTAPNIIAQQITLTQNTHSTNPINPKCYSLAVQDLQITGRVTTSSSGKIHKSKVFKNQSKKEKIHIWVNFPGTVIWCSERPWIGVKDGDRVTTILSLGSNRGVRWSCLML